MAAAVHVVCGPARAGKTQALIERYRTCLADAPGAALWIGPTVRAVEVLRERLLAATAALCCPRLYTFQDLLQEIVRVNDPGARPLTAAQRRLFAEDVIAELSGGGRLAHFASVADARGFTDGVLGLLTDLQRNAVTPEAFAQCVGAGAKQRQCAELYAEYQSELRRQNLHDSDGVAGQAGDLLRRGLRRPFDGVRAVFVDGFSDFTRPQYAFLELLCEGAEEVWVALPGEEDGRRAELFTRPGETVERLRRLGAQVEWLAQRRAGSRERPAGLLHLERQLFRPLRSVEASSDPDGVSVIEAPGVLGEARLVVRRIKRLLLDGASADDILVVVRDVAPYADVLTEVFDEYGVPAAVDGEEPLTRNPAAALLLRAARLLDDDWPFAGVTALLRNTYFRPLWPEADGPDLPQRAEAFLRLLAEPRGRDAVLRSVERWAEQQQPGLEDEQAEESRRRRTHELARECGEFIRRFFRAWDDAPATAPLAEHAAWLHRFAVDMGVIRAAGEDSRDEAALERLWHELAQWQRREERRHGRGGRTLDRTTFLRRLHALAAEASLPRSSEEPGRIRVLSANQARHLDADHVFILGLGERGFPRLAPPQTLLDEQERQELHDAGLDLGPSDLLPEEMLLFYEVVARARRQLVLSYPAVDERGQALLPSSFLRSVHECFGKNVLQPERRQMLIEGCHHDKPLSPAEYRVRAAAAWRSGGLDDAALPTDLKANLLDAADLNRLRFQERRHNPYDGRFHSAPLIAEVAQAFGPERVFSPTALEEYVDCPFKFFLRHVLRLEPLEDPSEEIEVTRRGQAYHRALARLHRKLKEAGVHGPADEVTVQVTHEMNDAVEEDIQRAPSPAAKELWRLEGRRLVKLATQYVEQWRKFVKPWDADRAPRPHLFEADFGLPTADGSPGAFGALVVRMDDVEVRVSGRIDRVDLAELPDGLGFWIIDYKTGRPSHYTGVALQQYRRLQLTLYALAVEEVLLAGRSARPLGLAYWLVGESGPKIALPGRSTLQWLEDGRHWRTVREQLRRWVATLVRHIREGDFALQPRDDHCTQTCAFGQICRITQARGVGKEGMLPLPLAPDGDGARLA